MSESAEEDPPPTPLLSLREELPPVVEDDTALRRVVGALGAGTGPIAVDAERAAGYRYSQRAYLVQIRRTGAGTSLIDPLPFVPVLSDDPASSAANLPTAMVDLATVMTGPEWIVHAASQDLPCLAELGLAPTTLFDTELAGRLLGYPKVGLATLAEEILGFRMRKEHSAVDWSTRPLPEPWLHYAALDVEMLVELRDHLGRELVETGKLDWATEEFASLAAGRAPEPRREPWRRLSGLHRVRDTRQLAIARELWFTRDEIARRLDVAPTRVLLDAAICEAALKSPNTRGQLLAIGQFRARRAQRHVGPWLSAINRARDLRPVELPDPRARYDGPPPARAWPERDPDAAARLAACRAAVGEIAHRLNLPVENLVAPDAVRRLAWTPPDPLSAETVSAALRARGAREWQISLVAATLSSALEQGGAGES